MADFGEGKWVKGSKPHRCVGCWTQISKGEVHFNYHGRYDGDWQNWRMHKECQESWDVNGCGEFTPGDFPIPDRLKEAANGK